MSGFQLAQINIAQAKYPLESEEMSGFTNRLDEINAIADKAQGFVWRLQTEEGDATTLRVFPDPALIVNLSVWENIETLQNFIYKSMHIELMQSKNSWFNKIEQASLALWWVQKGHIPKVDEAKEKLSHIDQHGSSPKAFTFAKPFNYS